MAINTFPELADLVAADLYAGSALWRYPDLGTCVLRLCYTLGPSASGTLASFLAARRVPMVLGFDPLYQFMHDDDAADAIVLALEKELRGVYNVSGPQPMPLSWLIRRARRTPVPLPEPLVPLVFGRLGFPRLPPGAVAHFAAQSGFKPRRDEDETVADFLRASPPR
jgi:UDP-glucose 4-epimerase